MAPAGAARVDGMGWDGMLTVVHFPYAEAPKRCLVPQSRVATVLALTPARQCAERAVGALLAAQDMLCAGHPWALPCAWATAPSPPALGLRQEVPRTASCCAWLPQCRVGFVLNKAVSFVPE